MKAAEDRPKGTTSRIGLAVALGCMAGLLFAQMLVGASWSVFTLASMFTSPWFARLLACAALPAFVWALRSDPDKRVLPAATGVLVFGLVAEVAVPGIRSVSKSINRGRVLEVLAASRAYEKREGHPAESANALLAQDLPSLPRSLVGLMPEGPLTLDDGGCVVRPARWYQCLTCPSPGDDPSDEVCSDDS